MNQGSVSATPACPVNSHNEWDPLEEVIVGSVEGAMFPTWDGINKHTVPSGEWEKISQRINPNGSPYPPEYIAAAKRDLEEFIHILRAEGVIVRRVDDADYAAAFGTPAWQVSSGFCAANPRDPFLVIGNEIIETPMADRSRYFEAWAYRSLFKEYFKAGARWVAAPKPQLPDALFDPTYQPPPPDAPNRFVLTEFEPVFDAADFVRCGRDIFGQLSHVTNRLGAEWLQRHLGHGYRVHVFEPRCRQAMHIDTTFMPLAPGKVIVNSAFVDPDKLPPIVKAWDLLPAPQPVPARHDPAGATVSGWVNINVLMLDQERVIVEEKQIPTIDAFKKWGFKPIPCPFENYYPFFGSFHCATLDIRRRGTLESYF